MFAILNWVFWHRVAFFCFVGDLWGPLIVCVFLAM